jgi:acetylglutamate kinase
VKTVVLALTGKDLDDALSFNRLRGDLKKLAPLTNLVLTYDADFQIQKMESQRKKTFDAGSIQDLEIKHDLLLQLGKVFSAKLSEDLIAVMQMNAHHLGLIRAERNGTGLQGKIESVKREVLEKQFKEKNVPLVTPIVKTKSGELCDIHAPELAAEMAVALEADVLVYAIEEKKSAAESIMLSEITPEMPREFHAAGKALQRGVKNVFVTTLSGMESVLLKQTDAATKILR